MPGGSQVFTSNVDGQFQKAGFAEDVLTEVHGSLHHWQCLRPGCHDLWPADAADVQVDATTFRALGELPHCPQCGGLARPNVLMFGDGQWEESRTARQQERLETWLQKRRGKPLVVIECGAGTAVPSVRAFCEFLAARRGAQLIRINLREPQGPPGTLGLGCGALEGLQQIAKTMGL